ncbi:hypothetical protein GGX14DRAFT_417156 [Mycena pura]|uniref:Uncharacterized protein n=1 Tax=Mycena pura TaxID=153505 RepID=A0AAD6YQR7_9AGAR|nr:hypothetical protein GGX14DRAFT_417156 [Mycena pura]
MHKIVLTTTFLAATVAAALSRNVAEPTGSSDCKVQAWVRAEDLTPDHVSHGELRIKVVQPHCANSIASVALRLELTEFGEVKHLRKGAVLPEIKKSDNQTLKDDILSWGWVGNAATEVVYDYGPYDRAMSDPALWVVKAEERTVWSTEATLFDNNPTFSRPIVKPFLVASPAVNYPPSFINYHRSINNMKPVKRHAGSNLGYHYIAVVNFTDGRTVDLRAGHTTFVPISPKPLPAPIPFTWNATFSENEHCQQDLPQNQKASEVRERCLPENLRSVFVAEVTLEDGNTIQRGKPLKGRVTVHSSNGSTKMSDISVTFTNTVTPSWAVERATTGGDPDFHCLLCQYSSISSGAISADSSPWLFEKKRDDDSSVWTSERHQTHHSLLTEAKPYFDFELPILRTAVPNFSSYYSSIEAVLQLELTVSHSRDVADCIHGVDEFNKYDIFDNSEDEPTADDISKTEEGLWDSYTAVGEPRQSEILWRRTLCLQTTVPLVILGDISEKPVEHYLSPRQPSPIILTSPVDVAFTPAHPVITEEPLVNTSARLMLSDGTFDPYESRRNFWNRTRLFARHRAPDPAAHYNEGDYAGLLWKKKVVAEERGILPAVTAEGEARDSQRHFVVAP